MEEEELFEYEVEQSMTECHDVFESNSNRKPDGYLNEIEKMDNNDAQISPWNLNLTGVNSPASSPAIPSSRHETISFKENDRPKDETLIKMVYHPDLCEGNNLNTILPTSQVSTVTCYKTNNEKEDDYTNLAMGFPALPSLLKEISGIKENGGERDKLPIKIPNHEDGKLEVGNRFHTPLLTSKSASVTSKSENEEQNDDSTNDIDIDVRSLAMGLPPIPSIPSDHEYSTPTITTTASAITTATISLESLPPIPLPRTCMDIAHSSSSKVKKARCKQVDCKWYGNVAYGGFCSDCFMCLTIEENSPVEEPSLNSQQLRNQLCLGMDCQFFGASEFDGYCSQCHSKQNRMSNTTSGWCRDDMKMCIICLQLPYNTVLLPCGHLYLCYQCASSIKNKNGTCPACRTTIRSFHRVYTPD